jgi:hypothetical protein
LRALPGVQDIVPFAINLAFDEAGALKTFVLAQLNRARTKTFRV